ncbi:HAMP domain-containing sensor histidine kinase [Ramlibacter sp. 2FC]|uniref:sensor histidine kinase n=1 Tax=Ramlibacter sp. 2FC TaxID=2502188 RepID=UPI0010F7C7DF|nr:HAMP domain-containing sensor histidine kinase [Ramlibacter sp. 2FC]
MPIARLRPSSPERRRPGARSWRARLAASLRDWPLEPLLHASPWRLRLIGLFNLVGQPLFGWIWTVWLPQPWESPWLRLGVAALGIPFLAQRRLREPQGDRARQLFALICWLQLPLYFSWMYLCNGGNAVWLSSLAAVILIYHQLTDWRLAALGTATGGGLAWLLFLWLAPAGAAPMDATQAQVNALVLVFAWSTALALGFSAANLRREQVSHTLASMGIMAHELRTPLATMALVGDALRGEAAQAEAGAAQERLERLAGRLHSLVRHMNHQIDMQIANARLLRLRAHADTVSAADVVRDVVHNYPYRSTRERECLTLDIRQDFQFVSSFTLFTQVIANLLKNALHALAATGETPRPGDLHIEVNRRGALGLIVVRDAGVGIAPRLQTRIFEPFFSTSHDTGHGLGLAFCRRVLDSVHGRIRVASRPGQGATFTLEIPLH